MSEMPKAYEPDSVEPRILDAWLSGGYFGQEPVPGGPAPYVVVIPPPNVTGSLHMGHALNNTIQDVVTRRMRMRGVPTRWVVGTDHAGIATQNKVEQKIAKQGKTRFDLGREAFVEACWEWRREHGSTIISQLKKMGCGCDYGDEWFTMDPSYQAAVRKVFVEWYRQGLVYRGKRIINWCPRCGTALSDIEVEHEERDGKIWSLRYPLAEPVGGVDHVVVATTRPETMLGDTCIAVHPDDERYRDLIGATVILPLMGREIPIVADDYVDPAFGTGAVKVTPAHDPNDFEIGERHGCAKINILDADARITAEGGAYEGLDRYEARERVIADLDAAGLLVEVKDHRNSVGHCYRCQTVIEPWLSDQWFVDMKPLAAPAIEAVRDGSVTFHPERWSNVYFHWMENIRDWCISRQLWWGHRIPVFYCDACGGEPIVSEEDLTACPTCGGPVRQDEDVLDTWFSSQLWPFATLGWPEETPELDYFYPTSVLSTARDILFLWVARMVMSGLSFRGDIPFKDVIIHPTVFNAEGKRMSKSLGTGVDPLDLMAHYGADGMRFGLMLQVTGNQDIRFSEEKLVSSRNFANKIYNASRFVMMNLDGYEPGAPIVETAADAWILSRLAGLAAAVDEGLDAYEFGEVSRRLYDFFWSEFADWYIELAKGRLIAGAAEDASEAAKAERLAAQRNLVFVLDTSLRLLHPMMPFVTEAIWENLPLGDDRAPMLLVAPWPDAAALAAYADPAAETAMALRQDVATKVRALVAERQLPRKTRFALVLPDEVFAEIGAASWAGETVALAGVDEILPASAAGDRSVVGKIIVEGTTVEVAAELEGAAGYDPAAELARLAKKLEAARVDLARLEKKLGNEGFLAKAAPEVIAKDRGRRDELVREVDALQTRVTELEQLA